MSLKEILVEARTKLLNKKETKSLPQEMDLYKTYRLVALESNLLSYDPFIKAEFFEFPCKPFRLPETMSTLDAYKLISYLLVNYSKDASLKSRQVGNIDNLLCSKLGFSRADASLDEVLDLYVIGFDKDVLKQSKYESKYFDFCEVSKEEIDDICLKNNINPDELIEEKKHK